MMWVLFLFMHCAASSHAHALTLTQPTETEHASYRIYYTGIPIGSIRLWWETKDQYAKITASIKTTGLLRVFNKQKRSLEVTGKHIDGVFTPIMYQGRVEYPHKQRSTTISYDQGVMREVLHIPELLPQDVIPFEEIGMAHDPLTAVVHLLSFMRDRALWDQPFANKIFDGRRLLMGYALPASTTDARCMMPCRTYQLYYKPMLGYDAEEHADAHEQKPMMIQYNAEQSYFPSALTAEAFLGTIEVRRITEDDK